MNIGCLDALLLFLVSHKDQSGYDIRQIFQSMPVGIFSDSPGAIYPALARLEMRGLLSSRADQGGRRKRIFAQTKPGHDALLAYLCEPVRHETVKRRQEELDLRYVMISMMLGEAAAQTFVRQCADAYTAEVQALEVFRNGPGQGLGTASLRALDLGIRLCAVRREWCFEILKDRDEKGHDHENDDRVDRGAGTGRAGSGIVR